MGKVAGGKVEPMEDRVFEQDLNIQVKAIRINMCFLSSFIRCIVEKALKRCGAVIESLCSDRLD